MAKNKKQEIKNRYSLRRRFFNQQGQPKEWEQLGYGEWQGIELVQKQIKTLASSYKNRAVEIEFKRDGKLLGFDGSEIGRTILYHRR